MKIFKRRSSYNFANWIPIFFVVPFVRTLLRKILIFYVFYLRFNIAFRASKSTFLLQSLIITLLCLSMPYRIQYRPRMRVFEDALRLFCCGISYEQFTWKGRAICEDRFLEMFKNWENLKVSSNCLSLSCRHLWRFD